MKTWITVIALLLMNGADMTMALADTSPKPDMQLGKQLFEKSCMSCHAAMFHGDATRIFTRPDHKVHNLAQLSARVEGCSANNNTGWFPDDEADVVAYLNQKFYKFK